MSFRQSSQETPFQPQDVGLLRLVNWLVEAGQVVDISSARLRELDEMVTDALESPQCWDDFFHAVELLMHLAPGLAAELLASRAIPTDYQLRMRALNLAEKLYQELTESSDEEQEDDSDD